MIELSDYEKGFLTAHFEAHLRFEDYKCKDWYEHLDDDQEWVGVSIGDRMFDICIWLDPSITGKYPQDLVAVVYECDKTGDGNWTTNTDRCWFLKEDQ
jgi:hypothetical protein